ncbi:D(4) dopamine receptor-like [Salvelinus namaycush]|uniref:D(4) dopamine receptor-like n=1 Tax=Salvelinus namaycush TaxID=8040 RepID=A0A8U1F0S0_SALNM|nr:D(4) dopamine receptor-like [Salvelinus namaycush]
MYRTRTVQTTNNALLVNLAANDLLKCSLDTSLLLSVLLEGRREQQFTYALCSCVQLLTLVSISIERVQAIAFPFHNKKTKARIQVWILAIWAFGLLLAMCRRHVDKHADRFGAYILVPVWGCSLTLIVIHYVRIFKVVRQHGNKVSDRGIQLRPSVSRHIWSWQNSVVSAPRIAPGHTFKSLAAAGASRILQLPRCTVITVSEESSTPSAEKAQERVRAVCLLTPTARERGQKRTERKLAKRFGYIIITFTLFWMPMVVILLIHVIVTRSRDSQSWVLKELETSAMVLTCVPAAVDPLIYTMVTRQFRSEFSKLISSLLCRG